MHCITENTVDMHIKFRVHCLAMTTKTQFGPPEQILVTGASGLIGSYLVQELLKRGHHVVGLDRGISYKPPSAQTQPSPRIADRYWNQYRHVSTDAGDPNSIKKALINCTHFVSLAALSGGIRFTNDHQHTIAQHNAKVSLCAIECAANAYRKGQLKKNDLCIIKLRI